jgi:ferritin-like metal-binding protein YciE
MKTGGLKELFVDELKELYSSEKQCIDIFPVLVELSSQPVLKEALKAHLERLKKHLARAKSIFISINVVADVEGETCDAMKGMIQEANELTRDRTKSHVLDAAIISIAQKITHYKIASYGVLRSFARHLDFDSSIVELLQETLNEEGASNKKFTKIADGSFFSSGVNEAAAEELATK